MSNRRVSSGRAATAPRRSAAGTLRRRSAIISSSSSGTAMLGLGLFSLLSSLGAPGHRNSQPLCNACSSQRFPIAALGTPVSRAAAAMLGNLVHSASPSWRTSTGLESNLRFGRSPGEPGCSSSTERRSHLGPCPWPRAQALQQWLWCHVTAKLQPGHWRNCGAHSCGRRPGLCPGASAGLPRGARVGLPPSVGSSAASGSASGAMAGIGACAGRPGGDGEGCPTSRAGRYAGQRNCHPA
mmetsp:Transcript_65913/g.178199  ORF Transcript_65913/g.178199 Transcript_65913/m.178199 type:complete len:240 (-) Transcript_65913:103-822(-)